jgi:hypothetical protein
MAVHAVIREYRSPCLLVQLRHRVLLGSCKHCPWHANEALCGQQLWESRREMDIRALIPSGHVTGLFHPETLICVADI